ncbi:MAG: hypothetical protein J6A16_02920 [Oscillospiraceae bacterium]|nr:hypothetical protein [Oscillospiraceae bacterium]
MKKIILSAALCMALTLTGCAGEDKEQSSSQTTASAQSTTTAREEESSVPDTSAPIMESHPETAEPESSVPDVETTTAPVTEEPEVTEEAPDVYAEMISQYDNTFLGLPQKDKVYVFSSTGVTAEINGEEFSAVSCHDEHEGQLYYMCDFYISADGSEVYRYYEATSEYVHLPEEVHFPPLDPTTQTPEDIFAHANALYSAVCLSQFEVDYGDMKEIGADGRTYCRVTDERVDSLMDIVTALNSYFSQDIVNSLMEMELFREDENGVLYGLGGGRGSDPCYLGTTYELTVLNESHAEFTATSTYSTDPDQIEGEFYTEEYVFNMENQFGIWRFTNFKIMD